MKKRAVFLLVFGILVLSLVSAGGEKDSGGTASSGPVKIKVGVLAAMTALPIVEVVNNGLDKANGIEIELVNFTTGAPMNEAMAAGQIDASYIGAASVFALANFNAKMISEVCDDTVAIDLVARPTHQLTKTRGNNPAYPEVYGTAATVKGITVLCPAGTLSQYEVNKYLEVFGLTMNDIKFVPMEYAQAYQAFRVGEGDIVATRSPQSFSAVDEEGWTTVASLKNLKSSATAQVVVSESALRTKAAALATMIKLQHQAADKLNNDVNYAAQLLVDWFQKNGQTIGLDIAKKQLEVKPFYGTGEVKAREFGRDFRETLVDFMISSGQLEASQRQTVLGNMTDSVIKAAGLK